MNKLWKRVRARRDKRFLRRLERVLNENILEADVLFRGYIGGVYGFIYCDSKRGYHTSESEWSDGWTMIPKKEFRQSVDQTKSI